MFGIAERTRCRAAAHEKAPGTNRRPKMSAFAEQIDFNVDVPYLLWP